MESSRPEFSLSNWRQRRGLWFVALFESVTGNHHKGVDDMKTCGLVPLFRCRNPHTPDGSHISSMRQAASKCRRNIVGGPGEYVELRLSLPELFSGQNDCY
ncbi:hypothetical protein BJY00DRAFT_232800 [Aspergillus carlsbadensis]|nr:hypothetical protein BJY00DRAFT_232800 [Aspergillus carlsbadensis]